MQKKELMDIFAGRSTDKVFESNIERICRENKDHLDLLKEVVMLKNSNNEFKFLRPNDLRKMMNILRVIPDSKILLQLDSMSWLNEVSEHGISLLEYELSKYSISDYSSLNTSEAEEERNIQHLVNAAKTDIEYTEYLLNLKLTGYKNKRFTFKGVDNTVKAHSIDAQYTEKLLDIKTEYGFDKYQIDDDILNIVEAHEIDPDLTDKLVNHEYHIFGRDIKRIIDSGHRHEIMEFLDKTDENGDRFFSKDRSIGFGATEFGVMLENCLIDFELTKQFYDKGVGICNIKDLVVPCTKKPEIRPFITEVLEDHSIGIPINKIDKFAKACEADLELTKTIVNIAKNDNDKHRLNSGDMIEVFERIPNAMGIYKEYLKQLVNIKSPNSDTGKLSIATIRRLYDLKTCFSDNDVMSEFIDNKDFSDDLICNIANTLLDCKIDKNYVVKLCKNYKNMEITPEQIPMLIKNNNIPIRNFQKVNHLIKDGKLPKLDDNDLVLAAKFVVLYKINNINEIPISAKRDLLKQLVAANVDLFSISDEASKYFPLLPKNQEEYCSLLPAIVRSLGIESKELTPEQRITMFNSSMGNLSTELAKISDADFVNLKITQEYSKDDFIKDVLEKTKNLTREERQKVYDYFGFELHHNKNNETGFSITGYPVNLNNGKKLAQIEDPNTKAVVESLRPDVIRFSENNKILCSNQSVQNLMNEIVEALPEIRTMIGKKQHSHQSFDVMQHSLKVMQKITQDPKFEKLNDSDKKIMMLASLLHDITKAEGYGDSTHADQSSFDAFFISKKFHLAREEEIKLHTLIKTHEWLEYVNTAKSEEELTKRLQSVAFDLQQGNLLDMAEIFTHADLKAVRTDDSFHDMTEGKGRTSFDGTVRSFGQSADIYVQRLKGMIAELQKSKPLLPQTKVPKASRINEAITKVNPDGSTNIKGVYKDKNGLVVIKFNEVEDWEAIGFPKGSISRGIEVKKGFEGDDTLNEDVNTGNIKFIVHGLDYSNQLAKFDAFSLVDSDALLSTSYAERPESKFRFFRPQGVVLDVNSEYVCGGGNTDAGSGCGKDINEFKKNYIFGGERESDRTYISDLIKKVTGMNDEQYVQFLEKNKDKTFAEIEPAEYREKIILAFATINSNTRKGNRSYNEMYISNPNEVMAVFAYDTNEISNVGNPIEFLHDTNHGTGYGKDVLGRTEFLQKYAIERDIPFIVFGD